MQTPEDAELPMVAFFLKKDTHEVIMDFLGKVHASDNLIPITPEQASEIETEELWGHLGDDADDPFGPW